MLKVARIVQLECDEESTKSTIPIPERMDRLELIMKQSNINKWMVASSSLIIGYQSLHETLDGSWNRWEKVPEMIWDTLVFTDGVGIDSIIWNSGEEPLMEIMKLSNGEVLTLIEGCDAIFDRPLIIQNFTGIFRIRRRSERLYGFYISRFIETTSLKAVQSVIVNVCSFNFGRFHSLFAE